MKLNKKTDLYYDLNTLWLVELSVCVHIYVIYFKYKIYPLLQSLRDVRHKHIGDILRTPLLNIIT